MGVILWSKYIFINLNNFVTLTMHLECCGEIDSVHKNKADTNSLTVAWLHTIIYNLMSHAYYLEVIFLLGQNSEVVPYPDLTDISIIA